jgi:cytochrome c biogenesis protein CcdA/thiol-disulfide isomerase/thioredoxin
MEHMSEAILAFIAGIVTIGGPCILPLLPILLGTGVTGRHPLRPLVIVGGFVLSWVAAALLFASFGSLLGLGQGAWRLLAALFIIVFGVLMAVPRLQARLLAPLEPLMNKLQPTGAVLRNDLPSGFLLGLSLGAVWTPCAGPVLGPVLALLAAGGLAHAAPSVLAYAMGAGVPMLIIAYGGQWAIRRVRNLSPLTGALQRIFGILIIAVGFLLLTGGDLLIQTWVSNIQARLRPAGTVVRTAAELPVLSNTRPPFTGITQWWNTPGNQPLSAADLKGKVVLIDFWTYSCINCIRTQPVLKAWWNAYAQDGLVIIGVHTPEFSFEKDPTNVAKAIADAGLTYPIALDAEFGTWKAYDNSYWPAEYLYDRQGRLRHVHFGEGAYDETEAAIRALLEDGGSVVNAPMTGIDTTPNVMATQTGETYFGLARQENFVGAALRTTPGQTVFNLKDVGRGGWSLGGSWEMRPDRIIARSADATLRMRVHSDAMYVVAGATNPTPIRVSVDGYPPMTITVQEQKLYQVAKWERGGEHLVEITADAPGLELYTATFGR